MKNVKITHPSPRVYTGKWIHPKITFTYKGKELVKNKDYKLAYTNNKKVGIGKIKITGLGKFKGGKAVRQFKIITKAQAKKMKTKYVDENHKVVDPMKMNKASKKTTAKNTTKKATKKVSLEQAMKSAKKSSSPMPIITPSK